MLPHPQANQGLWVGEQGSVLTLPFPPKASPFPGRPRATSDICEVAPLLKSWPMIVKRDLKHDYQIYAMFKKLNA